MNATTHNADAFVAREEAADAGIRLAIALDVAESSGTQSIASHNVRERLIEFRLAFNRLEAATAAAKQEVYDLDAIPADPALATEPECCS